MTDLRGRDFLSPKDWTKDELDQILDLAFRLKAKGEASRSLDVLKGKTLLTLFFRPSTRTRLSFAAAMQQMGGFAQSPDPSDMRLSLEDTPGTGESIKDTARVVERYVDSVGIRLLVPMCGKDGAPVVGGGDAIIRKFAEFCAVPVLSMGSCYEHPTQAMADIMVMKEKLGDLRGKKIVMMWAYSPILRSWNSPLMEGYICAKYGMSVSYAYPPGWDFDASALSAIERECVAAGNKFALSNDPKSVLEGADVVFPRNWWTARYYSNTREEEQRLAARHKDWRLTESLLRLTNNARFVHVMPFDRGNEVDDAVADGPNSIVYDQAENLLHIRKAVLGLVMGDPRRLAAI